MFSLKPRWHPLKDYTLDDCMVIVKRFMGRKSGTKAIEYPVRPPSKKQLKRRARLMTRLSDVRDPKKEAIRQDKVKRQMSNPRLDEEIKTMFDDMQPEVLALSRSEAFIPSKDTNVLPQLPPFTVDGLDLLEHFDRYSRSRNKIMDTNIDPEKQSTSGKSPNRQQVVRLNEQMTTFVNGISLTTSDLEREANAYVQHKIQLFFRTMNPWFPRKEVPPEYAAVYKVFFNLQRHKLRVDIESYINIIKFQSFYGQYQSADKYFDEALALCPPEDFENTMQLWSTKIENLGRSGQIEEALTTLNRLQKSFQSTSVTLYNPLLRVLVDGKHTAEADKFWIRMHTDGIDLNVESFNIYLKGLAFRGEVERTFFVFKEMVLCQQQPNTESFSMLLHACGRAPWWVKGYEDIVFDALDLMEAAEFKPNRKIYNAIINVFAQSGDAMAAEYYFWEMRRKGIRPDSTTYNVLLESYARAQSVGLKYGYKGRYAPPPPQPLSEDEMAMREIGAKRTGQIMASGVYAEPVQPGRGTKNESKKVVLVDLYEDQEARETAMALIRKEAAELRQLRRKAVAQELKATSTASDVPALKDADDGKVRISWDTPDELEQALLKAGNDIDNIRITGSSGSVSTEDSDEEDKEEWEEEFNDDFDKLVNEESDDVEEGNSDDNGEIDEIDEILDENLPTTQHRQKLMFYRRIWNGMRDEDFSDPFKGEDGLKGALWAESRRRKHHEKQQESQKQQDGTENDEESGRSTSSSTSTIIDKEKEIAQQVGQRVQVLSVLDKEEDVKKDLDMMRKEIDREWDFLAFGRVPPQDYSIGLIAKQNIIKHRAMLAFEDMIEKRIEPNVSHWNRLLAVHSEAIRTEEALAIFNNIKKHDNLIDSKTYEYMVRMYVRSGEIDKALTLKNEAITEGFIPTEESYGLLIRAFTHRQKIVEALKALEEARSKGVSVRERNIKYLRNRCQALGVKHPDMPPDPNAWVKKVKEERRNAKLTSQRKVQPLLSKSFR